jgi:hypothetical protein
MLQNNVPDTKAFSMSLKKKSFRFGYTANKSGSAKKENLTSMAENASSGLKNK